MGSGTSPGEQLSGRGRLYGNQECLSGRMMHLRHGYIEKCPEKCIFGSKLFKKSYLPAVFEVGVKDWNFFAVCGFFLIFLTFYDTIVIFL